ncbi:MAG: hypothetical protein K6F50_08835 [Kiritimatiellae bacterium]|nr:hypothetical protein [Kiritimatiellia bacterium]
MTPTLVSAASAAVYADCEHNIVVHLIDANVSDETFSNFESALENLNNFVSVVRHKWQTHEFDQYPEWHGNRVIYARLVIQDLIPTEDWAVSLDGDTLWLGSPFELMKLRNDDLFFLASIDPEPLDGSMLATTAWFRSRGLRLPADKSYCAGLMLLNLRLLRRENFTAKAKKFLSKYPDPPCPEQMVMSYICRDKTAPLPANWGVFSLYHTKVNFTNGGLVHYVSDAPWNRASRIKLISDVVEMWYRCAQLALGLDLKAAYLSRFEYLWKRLLFLCFKLLIHVFCDSRWILRKCINAKGFTFSEMSRLNERWSHA